MLPNKRAARYGWHFGSIECLENIHKLDRNRGRNIQKYSEAMNKADEVIARAMKASDQLTSVQTQVDGYDKRASSVDNELSSVGIVPNAISRPTSEASRNVQKLERARFLSEIALAGWINELQQQVIEYLI